MSKEPASTPDPAPRKSVELTVLARMAGVRTTHVRRYLEFGLLEPERPPATKPASARFDPTSAGRVARAERLRRDLGLNYAGAVLVVELLDRISDLQSRVTHPPSD
jgi:hypothetical protein